MYFYIERKLIKMGNKYDINSFGENLKKLRIDRYKTNPEKYFYCKSNESLAEMLVHDRRTIGNWKKNVSHPNIEDVIKLCNYLDCDMDYLLNASDQPVKSTHEVAEYTGIEYDNVVSIINNKPLRNFLNYMLSSEEFNTLVSGINNEFINQYISSDILSVYKAPLMNRIKSAYAKFHAQVSPFEISPEKVRDFLMKEIPFTNFRKSSKDTFNTFLYENLSSDRINQIMITNKFTSTTDEYTIYNAFISDTVSCTYEIMEYMHTHELRLFHLAQSFLSIVNGYVKKQCVEKLNKFHRTFDDIKKSGEGLL